MVLASQNMPDPLLSALRERTHAAHEALHVHPVLRRLPAPEVTREDWLQALTGFYGFYKTMEHAYATSGSDFLERFPAGEKLANLCHDLGQAGIDVDTLPAMSLDFSMNSNEAVLAYLYLREGSSLGGMVISKNLVSQLGLQPLTDNSYFNGAGKDTGRRWNEFLAVLKEYENKIDINRCADDAAFFFASLSDWLSKNGDHNRHAYVSTHRPVRKRA